MRRRLPEALLASLLFLDPATAAGHGTLRVQVADGKGAPIDSASVKLTLKGTWRRLERTTPKSGEAFFHRVPIGFYRLRVQADGFEPALDSRACLIIVDGRTLLHRIVLKRRGGGRQAPLGNCPRLVPESRVSQPLRPWG